MPSRFQPHAVSFNPATYTNDTPKTAVMNLRDPETGRQICREYSESAPIYTDEELLRMIRSNKGREGDICRKLNMAVSTLRGRIADSQLLSNEIEIIKEEELDRSEGIVMSIRDMIITNPREALQAAQFHLTRKGKDRGWGDTPPIRININTYNEAERATLSEIAQELASRVLKAGAVDVEVLGEGDGGMKGGVEPC